jgi:hypothetical protein
MLAAHRRPPPAKDEAELSAVPPNELAAAREKARRNDRRAPARPDAGYVIRLARPADDQVEGIWGATTVICSGSETDA